MSLLQDLTKILKEANAGYNFKDNGDLRDKYYVNPEVNESNKNYDTVREDEIVSVLENSTNLDYTNEVDKYLRLLMPRYKRRVEVEDLNRNFWVISQAIAKMTQYLTIGWDTHIEVVPLPSGKNYGYIERVDINGTVNVVDFVPEIYSVSNKTDNNSDGYVVDGNEDTNIFYPDYLCFNSLGNIIPYIGYFNEGVFATYAGRSKIDNIIYDYWKTSGTARDAFITKIYPTYY